MGTLLTVLIIIASILLVLLVLMQNPKGGGLSTDFGSAQQLGGVKQTNDFVEKATWSLAGVIAILSISMTLMYHEPVVIPASADQQQEQSQQEEQPVAPAGEDAPE